VRAGGGIIAEPVAGAGPAKLGGVSRRTVHARRLTPALLVALALALPACEGDNPSPAPERARASTRPALCQRLAARVTGVIENDAAQELSGLAASRTQPGVLWTHNDSGDGPRLLAVDQGGRLLAQVTLAGAGAVDWEDIAAARTNGGGGLLYAADIGDNDAIRSDVAVYRLAEPLLRGGPPARTAAATRLQLRYPDGARDAEALLVDPATRALVVVSKEYNGAGHVYVAGRPSTGAITTLRRSGTLALGGGEAVTAGDVSGDGRTIVLRTYDRAFVWKRRRGESITHALRRRPCTAGALLIGEGQGEALALGTHGGAFYTVPEGARPEIRRYAPGV
jgi:hypothetical protein